MTYNELKSMSLAALIYRLRDQINGMPLEGAFMPRTGADIPAPFLAYIGDFEIRARFPDPKPPTDAQPVPGPHYVANPMNPQSTTQWK